MNILFDEVQKILIWIADLEDGELPERRGYTKTHLQLFDGITSKQLDTIVEMVNPILTQCDSPYRVTWTAGEVIPIYQPQGEIF